jgi:signal transduction histidine kinase
MSDSLRNRFRHLRHDLRNPLGTIKSALALMDDESLPVDARQSPRFRAMATRNAGALDAMIVSHLSDAAAALPALIYQRVSLRLVACAVRRDLRAEAEARGVTVVVGNAQAPVCLDAVGLELTLHELLRAALREAALGEELRVEFGAPSEGRISVCLTAEPPREPVFDEDTWLQIRELAARMGGTLTTGPRLVLSVPIEDSPTAARAPQGLADVAPQRDPLDGGEPGDDLRGAREREHGQPGAL